MATNKMTSDEMKRAAAIAALDWVVEKTVIGVGTGSTANFFIDALADSPIVIDGRLQARKPQPSV